MFGKQIVMNFFMNNSIDVIFHLPGIHTLPLNKSLIISNINSFVGRHENNITIMADGYARTSGKIGVIIVTPGPGLGNTISGCMEAFSSDIPLLIIHIDTGRDKIGKGILHELAEPESMFTHITKKTYVISKPIEIKHTFEQAYHMAVSGRKGPVLISMPYTFLEKDVPDEKLFKNNKIINNETKEQKPVDYDISKLEEKLKDKKRPIIIGGKSLMFEDARPIIEEICKGSSIPFLTTTSGKGIVNEHNPYSFGNIMQKGTVQEILSGADIALAIGTRLRDVDTRRRGVNVKELIHIDIDDQWFDKNYPASLKFPCDIEKILIDLRNILQGRKFDWDIGYLKAKQLKEFKELEEMSLGFTMIKQIRKSIPDDTTIVCDLNLPSYYAEYYLPIFLQNTLIMPRGISPIFYSMPAAIGAKIGRPDRPCLAICGDGGVLPAIGELSTMVKYNVPIVILVHNNNGFGILEDVMNDNYGSKGSMSLNNPDFCKLAKSFAIKSKRAKNLEDLNKVLIQDVKWDEPFLIEFNCPVFPPPWRL